MRRSFARLSLLAGLAMLIVLCLLTLAGPALAGSPFQDTPPLWQAHGFNSLVRLSYGDAPHGADAWAILPSNDPWIRGTLLMWWESGAPGQAAYEWGHWTLSNEGGTWAGAFTITRVKAQTTATIRGTGSGDLYGGYTIKAIAHAGWGKSPTVMKGSYWK
jgi:hypothetical protein